MPVSLWGSTHSVREGSRVFLPEMWQKGSFRRALLDKEERPGESAAEACGKEQRPREDPEKTQRDPLRKPSLQKPPRGRGPCFVCGAEGHLECTDRADLNDKKSAKNSVTLESTRS